jgi:hypothetical protein
MSLGKYANNIKSKKMISLAISSLLILSIVANIAYVDNGGNVALAQPLPSSFLPSTSSTTNNSNEGTVTTIDNNTNHLEQMSQTSTSLPKTLNMP